MDSKDIRWKQRLSNFSKVFAQLKEFLAQPKFNKLEEQGLIQCFEYNYELSWNVMKDFYESQGETDIQGSRDAFRLAFKRGLIEDGELWMDMIKSRALTSHTYLENTANEVIHKIINDYFPAFEKLEKRLKAL
jgi:nucleotidyltransferase substrate binding protein (TIGR01987 family)